MTSSPPTGDPWDALQRPGVVATDAPPAGRPIAFVAGDEVGFDKRLALPAVCLKCGTSEDVQFIEDWMARRSVGHWALRILRWGNRLNWASVKKTMPLPMCPRCLARADGAMKLTLAVALSPAWLAVVGITLVALASGAVAGLVVALLVLSLPVLGFLAYLARAGSLITVDIDDEGFVKLAGVHSDACEAIARAAGLETSIS